MTNTGKPKRPALPRRLLTFWDSSSLRDLKLTWIYSKLLSMILLISSSSLMNLANLRHQGHQLPPNWHITNLSAFFAVDTALSICLNGSMFSSYTFSIWADAMEVRKIDTIRISIFFIFGYFSFVLLSLCRRGPS